MSYPRFAIRFIVGSFLLGARLSVAAQEGEPDWLKGKDLEATYAGGIGLIFEYRCNSCHREGENAPMSFSDYDEIRDWVDGAYTPMDAIVASREMPPWPADPNVGHFANSQLLTAREIDLIAEWIESDLPYGDDDFVPTREWIEGWNIGKPDFVFDLPEFSIDAESEFAEVTVEIPTKFDEERWVCASEVRPGDESIIASIDAGTLGSFTPGNTYEQMPAGVGRRITPGETITVKIRYAKEKGRAENDQSKIGVVFGNATSTLADIRLEGSTDNTGSEVVCTHELSSDTTMLSLLPILGRRGASVTVRAVAPNGSAKDLLSVPTWNPLFVYRYTIGEPFSKGTRIEAIATFPEDDNEAAVDEKSASVSAAQLSAAQLPEHHLELVIGTTH